MRVVNKKCLVIVCFWFLSACVNENKPLERTYMNNTNDKSYFEIKQGEEYVKIYIFTQKDIDSLFLNNSMVQLKSEVLLSNSLNAFKLKDGRVVVVRENENEFPVYPSQEVLLNQLTSHKSTNEIFDGVNIYGENFPAKAKILCKELLQICNIEYSSTKNDVQILEEVDFFISKHRTKKFLDDNFLSLVALIGELVNEKYGSSWVMIKSKSKELWTPFLSKEDKKIFFADFILIDFDNKSLQTPILESYQSVVDIIKFNSK